MADRAGTVLTDIGPALDRGIHRLVALQRADGSWEGEVIWCTMILSQYVIVRHIVGRAPDDAERARIVRHYARTRTGEGGWPLHREGPPHIFTTTLAYVALRLLGVSAVDELTAAARQWLRRQPGGVAAIPTWGRFWLAFVDLYPYAGIRAVPPELYVLPSVLPFHPARWYCHTRYIYLGLAYLFGTKFVGDIGALRDALRGELYGMAYDAVPFESHPDPSLSALRARVLPRLLDRIVYEQRASRYQAISPVNGLLNCLALHAADAAHPELAPSLAGVEAWRWSDEEDGTRYAGARSHAWDTAFAVRAILACGAAPERKPRMAGGEADALRRAHGFLVSTQLVSDLPDGEREHRSSILGGWCFSDGAHRWPVSDCTAEALTAVLDVERANIVAPADRLPEGHVREAVAFILARQNPDGGFATYERARAGKWLDRLNPSEMFEACMVERSYVECTASCLEALSAVQEVYPRMVAEEVAGAVGRAIRFLRRRQRPDGAFPAAWGINFTYAIFHVVKALVAARVPVDDPVIARAAAWLAAHQRADGGWGEHFSSCMRGEYVPHPQSQAVMTGWALLALAEAGGEAAVMRRGVAWLASRQRADGSWPREAVNGVFFGTAMLEYDLYRAYFPAWALARCAAAPQSSSG